MMRLFCLLSVTFLLGCGLSHGEDRYLAAGASASDREWRASDYRVLLKLIREKKVPLPYLSDPDGQKILRRFCALENLSFGRNRGLPLETRLQDFLTLHQGTAQMVTLYVGEVAEGRKGEAEMSLLLSFMLHTSALGIDLVDEFLPTLPKDDSSYETRMAGLVKMKSGLATVFAGAYTSIAEDEIYKDAQRSAILEAVSLTVPQFATVLGEETKKEMADKFGKLADRFQSSQDQENLQKITASLKK